MVDSQYRAVEDWLLSSIQEGFPRTLKFSGGENLSDFTHKLMAYSNLLDHVLTRVRPRHKDREAYGQERLDPKVVCLAVEDMDIKWGPYFEIEHDPRYPIDCDDGRWQIAGDHRYDNVLNARRLLKNMADGKAHIVSEHTGFAPRGRAIGKDSVLGFLYHTEFGMGNLHFADHPEIYQEIKDLAARGETTLLHRIEEREEVIARKVWEILKAGMEKVYLVLEYPHFLSPHTHPTNSTRAERDAHLLFDFMDEEKIPHVVVVPSEPKLIPEQTSRSLSYGWEEAIDHCQRYDTTLAFLEAERHFIQDYFSRKRLEAVWGANGDCTEQCDREMIQNYKDLLAQQMAINNDHELQRQRREFEDAWRNKFHRQLKGIKGI